MSSELAKLIRLLQTPEMTIPREKSGHVNPKFLGIITTRTCNMACVYCDFNLGEEKTETIDIRTACAALDWMAMHEMATGRKLLNIHFFGGEPFLPMRLVKRLVRRARIIAGRKGLDARFEACTNGTFNEMDAYWITDNFDTIILSLDGTMEDQNRYRPMKGGSKFFHS
jgi:sulfatase maturation enzyme AslB (radical SAM superfamily)